MTKLGNVCHIKTGELINKRFISENPGIYHVRNSGKEPLGYICYWNTENDPIGIASRGSVGYVSWNIGRYFRGNLNYSCTVTNRNALSDRYLYYYLTEKWTEIQKLCTYDGIPALNKNNLQRLVIKYPSSEEQARIVEILDRFDTLTNSIGGALPQEIELRRRQYKYYRDLLLNFPEHKE